jgi:hypothetical protein
MPDVGEIAVGGSGGLYFFTFLPGTGQPALAGAGDN